MRVAAALRDGEHDRSVRQRVRPPMLELIVCRVQLGQPFGACLRSGALPRVPYRAAQRRCGRRRVHVPPADSAGCIDDAHRRFRSRRRGLCQIAPREKYATDEPSGEKNGVRRADGVGQFLIGRRFTAQRAHEQAPASIRRAFCRIDEPLAIRRHRERAEDAIFRNGHGEANGGRRRRRRSRP